VEALVGLVFLVAGVALYFLPSIIARNKRNAGAIFALNLLLGWTFVGWIVSLVWALTVDVEPMTAAPQIQQAWYCNRCRTPVYQAHKFCPGCGDAIVWPSS
jgi:hypothetical protein